MTRLFAQCTIITFFFFNCHCYYVAHSYVFFPLLFPQFKANGQPAEFPFLSGDIIAWKHFDSVNVVHKAGLFVSCKTTHSFCILSVSGFYFGKTRGLLGALDYEPWDDFKQPNGQVSLWLSLYTSVKMQKFLFWICEVNRFAGVIGTFICVLNAHKWLREWIWMHRKWHCML
jgi:hypothetical protein